MAAATEWGLTEKQRALVALRRMQSRLEEAERSRREPVAIVGMSCRFPGGSNTPDQFWDLLRAGRCAVSEVPRSRWDPDEFCGDAPAPGKIRSRYGAFLQDVDSFDP